MDKFNRPLQEENTLGVIEVPPVSLQGNAPPSEFRISFPTHREIAAPGNALKLEVTYSFNGEDRIHSPQPIKYTAVIDSIYVSQEPEQQAKELNLNFSEDTYRADLVIQSESHNKTAFRINQIRCHIQYRDGRKLCDVAVPKVIERLGESFSVEVPKQGRLDWDGNKVALEIDYKYNQEAKFKTIQIPYKLVGGGSGFPMWLWVFLVPILAILGVVLFLLIRRFMPDPIVHNITLTEVSEAGTPLHDKAHFILKNEMTLEFGPRGPDELRFDVGSQAFLYRNKKNLMLFADADDDEGHILDLPETLTLNQGEDDNDVRVRCEITDDASDELEEDDEPIIASNSSDSSPLDV